MEVEAAEVASEEEVVEVGSRDQILDSQQTLLQLMHRRQVKIYYPLLKR